MDDPDYLTDERDHWENTYQRILNIDDFTFENLKQMARWGYYLSLAAFALLFLTTLASALILVLTPHFWPIRFFGIIGFIAILFLFIGIFSYPAHELYQFSTLMKSALAYPHQGRFNTAMQHLKNMLRYMGILAIVFLSFCILIFVGWLAL